MANLKEGPIPSGFDTVRTNEGFRPVQVFGTVALDVDGDYEMQFLPGNPFSTLDGAMQALKTFVSEQKPPAGGNGGLAER
ncbi:hypothetical protein HYS29_02320 [Candidatus Microgenomates bacterium]|nr:hypothetical protein [Candidatus Microgenomates bacterium]